MKRGTMVCAALLLPLGFAACGEAGGEWQGTVRDSAGIEIVTNGQTGIWAGDGWTVREELRIGSAEGDPDYQFGNISGLDIDSRGRIYVLDQQAHEVRVYDPEGAFLARIGRRGTGPGELSQAAGPVLVVSGDTVIVPDPMQQRVTRYAPDGTLVDSYPIPATDGFAVKWLKTPDQELVQQSMIMAFPGQQVPEPRNLLLKRAPDGEITDTLIEMAAGETMDFSSGQPRMTIFAPEPMWTLTNEGRLVTANNALYRFRVHDTDGGIQRIVEKQGEQRNVTESDQEEFRRAIRQAWEDAGMPPQALDMMSQSLNFAAYYPAFVNLAGGPDGTVWVQSVQTPETIRAQGGSFDIQDLGGPDWDVFDGEGRYLGIVRMPPRFNPLHFQGDHIYGVIRDDLDVQHVVRARIIRPETDAPMEAAGG